ncbi:hypothetical protein FA15DRAFT_601759 [Coprinopsis marcescibilis]|uniref:Uncharacterized protein n=1 Tax=Coprinopsis marcescibilis TaxID=230819 RepID=A0A5C3KGR0_COPMA|nr:hypothetical protein FA15DRAFT_601759 [Coprinopsis marcescibilis]
MSPVHKLPLDIVHIIFLFCLPSEHNPYICTSEAPMLLTHVCRRWREVAFEMPLLWANIHVHVPKAPVMNEPQLDVFQARHIPAEQEDNDYGRTQYLRNLDYWESKIKDLKEMVTTWFSRAKGCKISLSLSQFANILDQTKGLSQVNEVVAVLLAHRAQWRSVELFASSPIIAQFLEVPTHEAPHLERISIKWQTPTDRTHNGSANKLAIASQEGLMTVPELKSLSLQTLPRNIMGLPVRWEGLTELIFDEYFVGLDAGRRFLPSDALDLLALCPRLVRCRLAISYAGLLSDHVADFHNLASQSGRDPVRKLVSLPDLKHFAVDEGTPLGDFFLCLDLPSLKEVVFSTAIVPVSDEIVSFPPHGVFLSAPPIHFPATTSPLIDLLTQCGKHIEKLTFDEKGLSLRDIERALELVPSLTDLIVNKQRSFRPSVAAGYSPTMNRRKPSHGYLTKGLLERLTPSPRLKRTEEYLCPQLISFSCKLTAPVSMQDPLIEFIRWRRQPWGEPIGNTQHPALQHCTIHFGSASMPIDLVGDIGQLKDVAAELANLKVDMDNFDLNVIYPALDEPFNVGEEGEGDSADDGAASSHSGSSTAASLMTHFVPRGRDMCAGMYGYGSWYASGGGGELRDSWFEAW